jgi:hypothetical protein
MILHKPGSKNHYARVGTAESTKSDEKNSPFSTSLFRRGGNIECVYIFSVMSGIVIFFYQI